MEFSYIIEIVTKGILYAGSTAPLIALGTYIYLAVRGDSVILLSALEGDLNWKEKAFLGLAAIGLLVSMYQGASAMLFWMPDSWGRLTEDGYTTVRFSIVAMFTLVGGLALLLFIDDATRNKTSLHVLTEQIASEREIHAATTLFELRFLKSIFEKRVNELSAKIPKTGLSYRLGREPIRVEGLRIDAYRELIRIIEARIEAREDTLSHGVTETTLIITERRMDPETRAMINSWSKEKLKLESLLESEAQEALKDALEKAREAGDGEREEALERALLEDTPINWRTVSRYRNLWGHFEPLPPN